MTDGKRTNLYLKLHKLRKVIFDEHLGVYKPDLHTKLDCYMRIDE